MLRLRPQILTEGAYVLRQVCVRNVVGGAIAAVGSTTAGGGGRGSGSGSTGGDAALAAAAAVAAPDRVRLVIWYRFFVFEPAGRVTTLTTANIKGVMRRLERGNLTALRDGVAGGGSGGGGGGGGGGVGATGGGEVCVGRWKLDEDTREVTLRVAAMGSRRFPVAAGAARVISFVATVSGFGACGWNRLELRRHFAVTGGAGGVGGLGGVEGAPDDEEEQSDFDLNGLSTRFRFVGWWGGDARLAEVYPPVRGRRVTEEVEGEEVEGEG